MKALTIKQPWAAAIIAGFKRVENRNWRTHYRGPLAIHAGKAKDLLDANYPDVWNYQFNNSWPPLAKLRFGAVIGVVDLVDVVPLAELPADLEGHVFADGPYCWILANPRPCPPIRCPGNQQLWTPDDVTLAALQAAGLLPTA